MLEDVEIPQRITCTQQPFTANDLLQSCSNASLNTQFLTQANPLSDPEEFDTVNDSLETDLDEFDSVHLPASLYSISKVSEWSQLQALESTEYTIHKNFKRALGKNQNSSFKIGQKVLFRNPDIKQKKFSSFSFNKLNLVGIIKEASRGEVYLVEVEDGEQFVTKSVFKGEMVPLDNGGNDVGRENKEELDFEKVFDKITEVAATMRETIYDSPSSFRWKKKIDALPLMSRQDMI